MSPKTQTQPSAAAADDAAAANAIIPATPPFWGWSKIEYPEPAGYWKAVRIDLATGGWVMQLGADPHPATAPYTPGQIVVGFQWRGYLSAGFHTFLVRFQTGPVSIRPNGGQISAALFLDVDGRGIPQAAQSNSVQYLQVNRFLNYGGIHSVSLGGILTAAYTGAASPYGEIINFRSELNHFPPPYPAAAGAQAAAAPEGLDGLDGEVLFDAKKLKTVEISPRKEAQARLDSLTVNV